MPDIRDDEGAGREPFGWQAVVLGDEEIERRAAEMDRARRDEIRRFSQPLPLPFPRPVENARPYRPAAEGAPPARGKHRVRSVLVLAAVVLGILAVRLASSGDPLPPPEPLPIPRLPPLPRVPPLPPERDPPSPLAQAIIDVEQVTVDAGASGRFEPEVVHARRGDRLRFTADGQGAHNVSFSALDDASGGSLPPPGPYLTTPGETYELVVELEPGIYTFRCDPHGTAGEVGTLIVDP
jgi:plastocyanin